MSPAPASSAAPRAATPPEATRPPLAFRELLAALRQRGFVLGVDQQLRLVRLLDAVDGECSPADLKLLLGPVLATDGHQQRLFYEVFDELYPLLEQAPPSGARIPSPAPSRSAAPRRESPAPRLPRRPAWPFVLAGLGLLLVLLVLGVPRPPGVAPRTGEAPAESVGREAVAESVKASPAPPTRADSRSPEESIPAPALRSARRTLVALPLVLWALFEVYRRLRARIVLRGRAVVRAPFVWPLRLDRPAHGPFEIEALRQVSRSLRRRLEGERERLDVGRSVAATVAAAGRVQLRYRATTKVPEYLALIDRSALGDHAAGFAGELARALEGEGLFVHRFFFDRDPRACQDLDGRPISLRELADRFGDDRLLLFSDGAALVHPISGRLEAWSDSFLAWRDRALLSPVPPRDWSLAEIALASRFLVVPASLDGLLALAERFESESPSGLGELAEGGDHQPAWTTEPSQVLVEQLRGALGEPTFQWLCACAVHPELQWDLTLYLATLPVMGPGLLTEEHLLRLVRLPWFRAGRLPGTLRWWLIRELSPPVEAAVRTELARLLALSPPPEASVAGESRALQLALQRAWLDRSQGRRRGPSWRRLRAFPPSRWRRDEAALRLLETLGTSILDLVLPRRARRALLRDGLAMNGPRTWPLLLLALATTGVLWLAVRPPVGTAVETGVESAPRAVATEERTVAPLPPPELAPLPLPDAVAEEIPGPQTTVQIADETGSAAPSPNAAESGTALGVAPRVAAAAPEAGRSEPATGRSQPLESKPPPAREAEVAAVETPRPDGGTAASAEAGPVVTALGANGVNVRMRFDREAAASGVEVPLEIYQRPVYFSKARVETGVSLGGRPWIEVTAELGNGGGAGRYGTSSVELLDAAGQLVRVDSKREKLNKGEDSIRVRFRLDEAEFAAVESLRLSVVSEYAPGPLRRLVDRIGGEDPDLPPVDPSSVEVAEGRAVLVLPTNLGDAELGLFLDRLDFLTVSSRTEGSKLEVAVVLSNPSGQDRLVTLAATLLDGEGEAVAQETDRRVVESGELEKRLDVRLRPSPEQLAAGARVRLELSSVPD